MKLMLTRASQGLSVSAGSCSLAIFLSKFLVSARILLEYQPDVFKCKFFQALSLAATKFKHDLTETASGLSGMKRISISEISSYRLYTSEFSHFLLKNLLDAFPGCDFNSTVSIHISSIVQTNQIIDTSTKGTGRANSFSEALIFNQTIIL
jgi:hypothetical protein